MILQGARSLALCLSVVFSSGLVEAVAFAEEESSFLKAEQDFTIEDWNLEGRRALILGGGRYYDCRLDLDDWVVLSNCRPIVPEWEVARLAIVLIESFFAENGCELAAEKADSRSIEGVFDQFIAHRLRSMAQGDRFLGSSTDVPSQLSIVLYDILDDLMTSGRLVVNESETSISIKLEDCN